MKRERDADAGHGPEGADAGEPEPEPEGEAKEEFYDTTPVKTTGLAFSFGAEESPLIKIAKGIEKALWESKTAEIMKSIMPEILDEATTFLSRIWAGGLGDVIRESLESSGSNVSAIETSKTLGASTRMQYCTIHLHT